MANMLRLEDPKAITGLIAGILDQFGRNIGGNWSTPKRLVVLWERLDKYVRQLCNASGKFVAAGLMDVDDFDPYSSIAISNDGDNWTFASKFSNTSYFNTYYGVAHGNRKYVAVGKLQTTGI
ncbi:hypothetical protein NXW16_01860 [Bacteroides thetaiotaomicron]|nr:hypothetical protein [Bacteroides thetaiotaomicron]